MSNPVNRFKSWENALNDPIKLREEAKKPGSILIQSPNSGRAVLHKLGLLNSYNRIGEVSRGAIESGQGDLLKTAARQPDKDGKIPLDLAVESNCGNATRQILVLYEPNESELEKMQAFVPGLNVNPHRIVSSWWKGSTVNQALSGARYKESLKACLNDGKFREATSHFENGKRPNLEGIELSEHVIRSGCKKGVSENEILNVVKCMIACGINVNHINVQGETVLMTAAKFGLTTIVQHLLQLRGADRSLSDKYGNTALHFAASSQKGDAKLLKWLLRGADASFINKQNTFGQSALHVVNHKEKATALLEMGANSQLRDQEKKIPLDSAIDRRKFDVAALLWQRDPRLNPGERILLAHKSYKVVINTIPVFMNNNKITKEDIQAIEADTSMMYKASNKIRNLFTSN